MTGSGRIFHFEGQDLARTTEQLELFAQDLYNRLARIGAAIDGRVLLAEYASAIPAGDLETGPTNAMIIVKGGTLTIAYKDSVGTVQYLSIVLDGAATTWTVGTTSP
jgi:hypothetical protein